MRFVRCLDGDREAHNSGARDPIKGKPRVKRAVVVTEILLNAHANEIHILARLGRCVTKPCAPGDFVARSRVPVRARAQGASTGAKTRPNLAMSRA